MHFAYCVLVLLFSIHHVAEAQSLGVLERCLMPGQNWSVFGSNFTNLRGKAGCGLYNVTTNKLVSLLSANVVSDNQIICPVDYKFGGCEDASGFRLFEPFHLYIVVNGVPYSKEYASVNIINTHCPNSGTFQETYQYNNGNYQYGWEIPPYVSVKSACLASVDRSPLPYAANMELSVNPSCVNGTAAGCCYWALPILKLVVNNEPTTFQPTVFSYTCNTRGNCVQTNPTNSQAKCCAELKSCQ